MSYIKKGRPRGRQHYRAKLTDEQVRQMRQQYQAWQDAKAHKGYGELAKQFNCGASTARDICNYRTRYDI